MKKKIFLVISAMLVFGLAIAVYSSGTMNDLSASAVSCCCRSGDSCPMKKKDAAGKEMATSCDDCECCKGDAASCPMMKKDADGKAMKMDDAKDCPMMNKGEAAAATMKMDDAASCPMMKKDGAATAGTEVKHEMKTGDGKGCCPMCHKAKDKEKKDAPAI